jgi:hypothetical protein
MRREHDDESGDARHDGTGQRHGRSGNAGGIAAWLLMETTQPYTSNPIDGIATEILPASISFHERELVFSGSVAWFGQTMEIAASEAAAARASCTPIL